MKKKLLLLGGLFSLSLTVLANPVIVRMNAISTTMTLQEMETKEMVLLPDPVNKEYQLDLKPGDYLLTAFATDGKTQNGTIVLNVTDSTSTQIRPVITCTAYVSNKDENNNQWTQDKGDYTLNVRVNTREGVLQKVEQGRSITNGRYTFLAFNGDSYITAFEPSEQHKKEGYMTLYKGGTLTANVNVNGSIPMGGDFSVTVPKDAVFHLGMKFTHFTDFTPVEPYSVVPSEGGMRYNYLLANGQIYNYRTWKKDGLTHGGYFTMNLDNAKCPDIRFSDNDYAKHDPKQINHDVHSNNGYETGDILLNINSDGHLKLKPGETFKVHAMRMWELSDNSTNNYFFEPDFHYTILGLDGKPKDGVIQIDNSDTTDSAWSDITAIGEGTAIVLVTYDGINLNYYNNADKKEYLGGEYWGAIWPENTGVFVVTVGDGKSAVKPEMIVNEQYNVGTLRMAGKYADAEHDVFYYLDDQDHFPFRFNPEGVMKITMASPVFTSTGVSYNGFTEEGVIKNEDGSYNLKLKEGRNIVMLTDASGRSVYRILRAKPCHREITNLTREGSELYQPGDKIKIQYSGLFHPANKIAGIYNMSAYVTYNGVPNGSSLILGSGQYTFGSAASAQAITVEIPEDYDAEANKEWIMDEGVIQVNGYGDPIGNHRNTSPTAGRSPNFTAVAHQTYFGSIPDIRIPITPMRLFNIILANNVEGAETTVSFGDKELQPDETGHYSWTYGTYNVTAKKDGYRCYRKNFTIEEGAEGDQIFEIFMEEGFDGMWDGRSIAEIEADENGVYHVSSGAELAFIQTQVGEIGNKFNSTVILDNDIDLGDFDWTPIGSSSKPFSSIFDGNDYKIRGLYINQPNTNNIALFGYVKGTSTDNIAEVKNVTVEGYICGKQYVSGVVANLNANARIEKCANYADITGTSSYVGGVVGYMAAATVSLSNSYNRGDIKGTTNVGGVIGYNNANSDISNIYSTGAVTGTNASNMGACVGATTSKTKVTNAYTTRQYELDDNSIVVSEDNMASGEIAFLLGDVFNQTIGEDKAPVFTGLEVCYDEMNDEYYNNAIEFSLLLGEGDDNVLVEDKSIIMHVGDSYKLEVVAIPEKARLPELFWSSDNIEKVAVYEGLLSALSKGETEVTVSATINGERIEKSCNVKIIGAKTLELYIDQKEVSLDINEFPVVVLAVSYGPEYADSPSVVWSSDDESVVKVENVGSLKARVIAIDTGSTTLRVKLADNPDVYDTCLVNVTGSPALIDSIFDDKTCSRVDIFDINGRLIKLNASTKYCKTLLPGIYLIKQENVVKQIIVK